MLQIPSDIQKQFNENLEKKRIPEKYGPYYLKWLRFYLDFCSKYNHPPLRKESLTPFIQKLKQKKQGDMQVRQASHAVSLYYSIVQPIQTKQKQEKKVISEIDTRKPNLSYQSSDPTQDDFKKIVKPTDSPIKTPPSKNGEGKNLNITPDRRKSTPLEGTSWIPAFEQLSAEIKLRHYSPKTYKVYAHWLAKFQTFTKSRELSSLCDY